MQNRKKLLFIILISLSYSYLFGYTVISHKPIDYFIPDYRILIEAKIKSFSGNVQGGKVHFKSDKNREFFTVLMQCKQDICKAVLPAPSNNIFRLDYFITVINQQGEIYKTQVFSVGRETLPKWHILNNQLPLAIYQTDGQLTYHEIDGFTDKIKLQQQIHVNKRKTKNFLSQEQPHQNNSLLPLDEYKLKLVPSLNKNNINENNINTKEIVNFAGVWVIKRSLSTCNSNLSSQKVVKIESKNGVITSDETIPNATKFLYDEDLEFFQCKLIDDNSQGYLIGEKSQYDYYSFLESLQTDLLPQEHIKILEFSWNKISFELSSKNGMKLWTTYLRQPTKSFYKKGNN